MSYRTRPLDFFVTVIAAILVFVLSAFGGTANGKARADDTPLRMIEDIRITVSPDALPGECLPASRTHEPQSLEKLLNERPHSLTSQDVVQFETAGGDWRVDVRPVTVTAEAALIAWCEDGDLRALQLAINHADWLVENARLYDGFATWTIDEARPPMFVPAGWTGAIFDGRGMIVLLQVYALTHDSKYGDMAAMVSRAFSFPVSEGGLVRSQGEGQGVFFEEAAHPDAPPGQILNGDMLAIEMLAYYADHSGDAQAARMVDEGILGVRSRLADYDASTIALYSLGPIRWGSARTHYAHGIHIHELFWMYSRTGDPVFLEWALRWQRYMWPALPASLYYDDVSDETFRFANVDAERHMDVPVSARSLILDLYAPVTVRSFGYSMVGPYPADFTIDVSLDAKTWETVTQISDADQQHGSYFLGDVNTRYIRMSLDRMAEYDDPYYYGYANGFYRDRLMLGVLRVDGRDYWEKPVLLLTEGDVVILRTERLQDSRAETGLAVPANAVLYGDLREPGQIAAINFDARDDSGERRLWLEASVDLSVWTPLASEGDLRGMSVLGSEVDYRYFRLRLEGSEPLFLTQVTVEKAAG